MTDEEVICTWMERRPQLPCPANGMYSSEGGWWFLAPVSGGHAQWFPMRNGRPLNLDALHEVEQRLTDEQWKVYDQQLETGVWPAPQEVYWNSHQAMETLYLRRLMIHADAPARIKALASMLRPIVAAKQ